MSNFFTGSATETDLNVSLLQEDGITTLHNGIKTTGFGNVRREGNYMNRRIGETDLLIKLEKTC